jgi:hypothetical protein
MMQASPTSSARQALIPPRCHPGRAPVRPGTQGKGRRRSSLGSWVPALPTGGRDDTVMVSSVTCDAILAKAAMEQAEIDRRADLQPSAPPTVSSRCSSPRPMSRHDEGTRFAALARQGDGQPRTLAHAAPWIQVTSIGVTEVWGGVSKPPRSGFARPVLCHARAWPGHRSLRTTDGCRRPAALRHRSAIGTPTARGPNGPRRKSKSDLSEGLPLPPRPTDCPTAKEHH